MGENNTTLEKSPGGYKEMTKECVQGKEEIGRDVMDRNKNLPKHVTGVSKVPRDVVLSDKEICINSGNTKDSDNVTLLCGDTTWKVPSNLLRDKSLYFDS